MMTRRSFLAGAGALGASRLFAVPAGSCTGGKPNLRFGVLSDLHIRCTTRDNLYDGSPRAFEHALEYFRDRQADAVMIAGDMSDLGIGDELVLVGQTWDKVFPDDRAPDGRKVEKIFITGNHESGVFINPRNLNTIRRLYGNDDAEVRRQLLRSGYATWWEKAFHEPYARFYHKNVKGYDFLCANWDNGILLTPETPLEGHDWRFNGESFGVELKAWLDANGRRLDPSRPFFYQQHRCLWKTTYADWGWNHDNGKATEVLSAWPNAVSFAGDTHFPLSDDRSIWQGSFTALGTASLRYPGQPYDSRDLASFENTCTRGRHRATYDPLKTMKEYVPSDTRQGMLVSVYDDRMVFERRDFAADCPVGDDWVVPLPVAGSAKPYGFKARAEKAKPPRFAPDAKLSLRRLKAKTRGGKEVPAVEIEIPAIVQTSDCRCAEYAVTAIGRDGATAEFNVLAEGCDCPPTHARVRKPTVFSVAADRLPAGTVRFEVRPLDAWWNRGPAISVDLIGSGTVAISQI